MIMNIMKYFMVFFKFKFIFKILWNSIVVIYIFMIVVIVKNICNGLKG